jgi:hypothetical protein
MSRRRILFFTYYRLVPTGQIGVFKRCMRLIDKLPEEFEIHLVNYGPLPEGDMLFSKVQPRLQIHQLPGLNLGTWLKKLLEEVRPNAVVHGEAPLRGNMRLSHRVCSSLGIPQVAIDNYYGEYVEQHLLAEWPNIDCWLLLGLIDQGQAARSNGKLEIMPPFVQFPPNHGRQLRDRVVVMGYDRQTLITGIDLIKRLPSGHKIDVLITREWESLLDGLRERPGLRVLVLPNDAELYDSLSHAKVVFGKAGFQQVVESIGMGAPIICQSCGGGIGPENLAGYLQPYVRFVSEEGDLSSVLFELAGWLLQPPVSAWSTLAERVSDPIHHGAKRLAAFVEAR